MHRRVVAPIALSFAVLGCAQITESAKVVGESFFITEEEKARQEASFFQYTVPASEPVSARLGRRIALAPTVMRGAAASPMHSRAQETHARRLSKGLDEALAKLLAHRGFDVSPAPQGEMTYAEKRGVYAKTRLVVLGYPQLDAANRRALVDDPTAILEWTEPMSGQLVLRQIVTFAEAPIVERYIHDDQIDPGLAITYLYRKLFKTGTRALEREVTAQAILSVAGDVAALKQKAGSN